MKSIVQALKAAGLSAVEEARRVRSETGLSLAVALFIETMELLQVETPSLGLRGGIWCYVQNLDFGYLGYIVVAMFVAAWVISYLVWRMGRVEGRWSTAFAEGGGGNAGEDKRNDGH